MTRPSFHSETNEFESFSLTDEANRPRIPARSGKANVLRHTLLLYLARRVDEVTEKKIRTRVKAGRNPVMEMDQGYVKSIYITDPDGLMIEFTVGAPSRSEICALKQRAAHEDFEK